MNPASRPRATGLLKGADLGDEFLFYDRDSDRVHVLNGTAREIFLLLDGSRSEDDVAVEIARRFEIALTQARDDVGEVVRQLRTLGVIGD